MAGSDHGRRVVRRFQEHARLARRHADGVAFLHAQAAELVRGQVRFQDLVGLLARLAAAGAEVGPAEDVPALDGAPETARAVLLRSGSDTMALEIRTGGPGRVEAP